MASTSDKLPLFQGAQIRSDKLVGGLRNYLFMNDSNNRPKWVFPLLGAALIAVSSAGAVFATMREVPPITLAAWRLQGTVVVLAGGFVYQWRRHMDSEMKQRFKTSRMQIFVSGLSLALHFGFWVAGIFLTSLAHSLLFVSATPVVLVLYMRFRNIHVSKNELYATGLAVVGAVLLMVDAKKGDDEATVWGDFICLLGAAVYAVHLELGRALRSWMPIYVYAAPVTATAALILSVGGILIEGSHLFVGGASGVFGYLTVGVFFWKVLYLSLGPGFVGHTGLNTLLRYIPPLLISLTLTLEPLLGSLIGAIFKVQGMPGPLTWVGGFVLLCATALVVYATDLRQRRAVASGEPSVPPAVEIQMQEVFGDANAVSMRKKTYTVRKPDGSRYGSTKPSPFELAVYGGELDEEDEGRRGAGGASTSAAAVPPISGRIGESPMTGGLGGGLFSRGPSSFKTDVGELVYNAEGNLNFQMDTASGEARGSDPPPPFEDDRAPLLTAVGAAAAARGARAQAQAYSNLSPRRGGASELDSRAEHKFDYRSSGTGIGSDRVGARGSAGPEEANDAADQAQCQQAQGPAPGPGPGAAAAGAELRCTRSSS